MHRWFGRTIKEAPGTAERLQGRLRLIAEAEERHDLSAAHRAEEFFVVPSWNDTRNYARRWKLGCWPVVRAGALGLLEVLGSLSGAGKKLIG